MHRLLALVAVAALSILTGLPVRALADTATVRTDEVCFTVHNQGDPTPSSVNGVRFYVGNPTPETKVIVLVHGHSITHAFWDVAPDFSVARNLARAGYLVLAYDRLGYGKSPYQRPRGSGFTLTVSSQRAMLHEIVTQVKSGAYTFTAGDGTCDRGRVAGLTSPTVILIGHSGGGAIVSGYPGIYHDVAAVAPVGWTNQGMSSQGAAYIATTLAPQWAAGNDYVSLFPSEEACRRALLYLPEVVPSLLPTFCPSLVDAPAGEALSIGRAYAENLAAISRVGPDIPVLLAFADRDFFFSANDYANEVGYWKAHCGCDVESWTQQATGHALIAHRSMPTFTSKVVAWLRSKGLAPE